LVIGLKGMICHLGVLLWFSMENMIMMQQAMSFYLRGVFSTSLGISYCHPFRLGHSYDSFLQVLIQLSTVALLLLCLDVPQAIVCYRIYFTIIVVE
jgi:hypothetical protein